MVYERLTHFGTHASDLVCWKAVALNTDVSVSSLAAVLWLSVFVMDVFKDVSLAIHQQRLPCNTYNRPAQKKCRY